MHGRYGLVIEPEYEDAAMGARWVAADVAEASVQRDQEPPLAGGSGQQLGVRRSAQPLVPNGVDVVLMSRHQDGNRVREILVELDSHVVGSGRISSRESSAP